MSGGLSSSIELAANGRALRSQSPRRRLVLSFASCDLRPHLPEVRKMIRFKCPLCENKLSAWPKQAGLDLPCPRCKGTVRIPNDFDFENRKEKGSTTIEFSCPQCTETLEVKEHRINTTFRCPNCDKRSIVPDPDVRLSRRRGGERRSQKYWTGKFIVSTGVGVLVGLFLLFVTFAAVSPSVKNAKCRYCGHEFHLPVLETKREEFHAPGHCPSCGGGGTFQFFRKPGSGPDY